MKGGDSLALVQAALKHRTRRAAAHGAYKRGLLLIDADRLDDGSTRSRDAVRLAGDAKLALIRQIPCFEGVLLRLIKGGDNNVPRSTGEAITRLCKCWPEYEKPMTRHQLQRKLTFPDLQRLAQVDEDMHRLLEILGLPQLR